MTGKTINRYHCGACETLFGPNTISLLDFGAIPLAGEFPTRDELEDSESYPFRLVKCFECGMVQSDSTIDPNILFKDYRYISGIGLKPHFEELADEIQSHAPRYNTTKILEIGSNDGTLLDALKTRHLIGEGIDPSKNISKIAQNKGHKITVDYFSYDNAKKYYDKESFDFVIACNCFAHINNLQDIMRGIRYVLKKGGALIIEVHDFEKLIGDTQYDTIYHEHIYYWTSSSLRKFLRTNLFTVRNLVRISNHSGSLRITAGKSWEEPWRGSSSNSNDLKWLTFKTIKKEANLEEDVELHGSMLRTVINSLNKTGKVVGFGASGRANILCNVAHINNRMVSYIVDESHEKQGRYIPFMNIPIHDKHYLDTDPDVTSVIIFAWNYKTEIMKKLGNKYNYLIPFPRPEVIPACP